MTPKDSGKATRLTALRRFATTITILNIVGHLYLGFEQSWAAPFVGIGSAIFIQLFLEWVDARAKNRWERAICRGKQ